MSLYRRLTTRFSRHLKVGVQVLILLVILGAIGTVGFIEYSAQPSFCTNCHIMQPYYDSWASSSHNTVACIRCHYAPGIKAEAMGKLQAANQVVKYVTGAYGTKPWAEIEDASCLRSGCHSERKLEGVAQYRGIQFDHTEHLGELRRGKQLRCTSCHSQIVQGDHVAVTQSTCFLCHFKDRPPGAPVAGCTGCHPSPERIVSPAGFVVDHPQYVEDLVSCVGCHDRVTEGSGAADQSRCFSCHNEPDRIEQFENTTLVHRVHIAVHNVECAQCHTPVEHRVVSLARTFELDCASCHRGTHESQKLLYAGLGGHATENSPSSMYLARVSCKSCHGLPTQVDGHEQVQKAGEATCMSCHGIRYANILPRWQEEMQRRLDAVTPVIQGARRALGSAAPAERVRADSLLRLAEENVALVRNGRGAHNIQYADRLLRTALDLVERAVREASLPYRIPRVDLGPRLSENVCLQCHTNAARARVGFGEVEFDHETHVRRAGLSCSQCHTSLDEHGGTTLDSSAACDACHHDAVEPMNCARCHDGPGGAPMDTLVLPAGTFLHAPHREADLACSECHTAPEMSARSLECGRCHESHHQPRATCLSCHRGGALALHPPAAHQGCDGCHGAALAGITRWTREVCTACHADRVEHNAPHLCTRCHQIPELRGGAGSGNGVGVGSASPVGTTEGTAR